MIISPLPLYSTKILVLQSFTHELERLGNVSTNALRCIQENTVPHRIEKHRKHKHNAFPKHTSNSAKHAEVCARATCASQSWRRLPIQLRVGQQYRHSTAAINTFRHRTPARLSASTFSTFMRSWTKHRQHGQLHPNGSEHRGKRGGVSRGGPQEKRWSETGRWMGW